MDGKAEEAENPVDDGGGDHKPRVDGPTDDAAEWVPALGVEPVPELVEALFGEEEGGAIIEVGVEFMDHGLVAEDTEESSDEGKDVDEEEDRHSDQELLLFGLQFQGFERNVRYQIGFLEGALHCCWCTLVLSGFYGPVHGFSFPDHAWKKQKTRMFYLPMIQESGV